MKKLSFVVFGLIASAFAAGACSSTPSQTPSTGDGGTGTTTGSDGGSQSDSGSDGSDPGKNETPTGDAGTGDAGTDAAAQPAKEVNGCTSYVDRTAADADRDIVWDFSINTEEERCMKVKVGQKDTFVKTDMTPGNFNFHPLGAQGGDTPSPFPGALNASTGEVTFANAGTFGFVCTAHSSMNGAIYVVP
jgi:plastocyanin